MDKEKNKKSATCERPVYIDRSGVITVCHQRLNATIMDSKSSMSLELFHKSICNFKPKPTKQKIDSAKKYAWFSRTGLHFTPVKDAHNCKNSTVWCV